MRIVIFLIVFFPFLSFSQQGKQVSLAMYDKFDWNPAYAGLDYSLSVTGVVRNQWTGLPGSPSSQSVNAHLPFYKWSGGVGLQINNQTLGAYSITDLSLSYAYIKQTRLGIVSAGLRASFSQNRLDGSKILTPDGNYEGNVINHNDPTLSSLAQSGAFPRVGLGIYYYARTFELGLTYNDLNASGESIGPLTTFLRRRSINVGCIAKLDLNKKLKFLPAVMFKTDFNEIQTDLVTHFRYNGNIFGGIGIRGYNSTTLDAVLFSAGLKLNPNYTLFYSYDMGVSSLRKVNEGTHEIILNYNLNKLIGAGLAPKVIYNPRYL